MFHGSQARCRSRNRNYEGRRNRGRTVPSTRPGYNCQGIQRQYNSKIKTTVCWNLRYHREGLKQEVGETEVEDISGYLEPLPSQKGSSLGVSVCSTWGQTPQSPHGTCGSVCMWGTTPCHFQTRDSSSGASSPGCLGCLCLWHNLPL